MIVQNEANDQIKRPDSSSGFYSYFTSALCLCQNHFERGLIPVNIFAKSISDGYNLKQEHNKSDLQLNTIEKKLLGVYLNGRVDQIRQIVMQCQIGASRKSKPKQSNA
ncbi:unnamed protein product [Ambrosiozyma monospora]|uniref:Unnamed protein product n=1 Tax=Ambrosiozyma monospora TaxID=43982 RepID=A0ACB5T2V9_AMBMO|nr:unnamed protein product [Ambrosiozyma monospora]